MWEVVGVVWMMVVVVMVVMLSLWRREGGDEGGGRGRRTGGFEVFGYRHLCYSYTMYLYMYLFMYLMRGWSIQSLNPSLDSFEVTWNVLFSGKRRVPSGSILDPSWFGAS